MQATAIMAGLFALCFLLGSVPWGVIVSRVFFHTDVRDHGSGNIGTTNAIRAMGKPGGFAVFVLDFGKGLACGFIALAFARLAPGTERLLLGVSFLACVWGHIFSPWLKFKGGKGIAVAVGNLFVTFGPVGAIVELAIFAVLVVATRYVSVGSIASALACPFIALYFYWGSWLAWSVISLGALTVVWAHRANIGRLRAGTESRIGDKKKA